ncbi:extracellular solute-binding protein [Candidatus Aerophobetes bacterium]|nr:extracellular solute-binding protein [Candidatus Aerophobetes bacterium]
MRNKKLALTMLICFFVVGFGFVIQPATYAQGVELNMWFGRSMFIPEDNFKSFQQQYPHIKLNVDTVPLEETVASFSRAYRAGISPDIAQCGHYSVTPLLVAGMMQDMTKLIERWKQEDPELYADISQLAWDFVMHDGAPRGIAVHGFGTNGSWFVYRKDVLEKHGLQPPNNWDEVIDIARKVKTPDMVGVSMIGSRVVEPVWSVGIFMAMGGGHVNGVPQIDSEAGRYFIKVHQTLTREGLVHPETLAWDSGEMRIGFAAGRAAMAPIGWNIYPMIQKELGPYKKMWGQVPMPGRKGAENERKLFLMAWPYYVSNQTKHPYEASLVLRYLARPDITVSVASTYQDSTTMSVFDDPRYLAAKPWAADAHPLEYMDQMEPMPTHPRIIQLFETWKDLLQESLTNVTADPAEMARRYQREFNEAAGLR